MINIRDKKNCTGCSACVAVCPQKCIKMKSDEEGFYYPKVDQKKCLECNSCEEVCPIRNTIEEKQFEQEGFVVQNRDSRILAESTAGGAFTAIAQYVIRNGGIVFGVVLNDQYTAEHTWIENESELSLFRGSKYVQSYISEEVFDKAKSSLDQGRLVCFSGTPCQVEGLKSFLRKDYDNLVTVDVVCRAVPSPMVFKKYIDLQEGILGSKIRKIRFRDKYYGYKYSTMNIITENNQGDYHQGVESDLWLRAYYSGICLRPSCYQCQFKKRYRVSDFTMWDCFAVDRYSKELNNDKGVTKLLVHSKKGKKIFKQISSDLMYVRINPDLLVKGTKEMFSSIEYNDRRELFMRDAKTLNAEALFDLYFPITLKVIIDHLIRMICLRLGIYSIGKKIYVRITHKY
ncbi:MAG: 4Fe-4S dicluster domain-containing protein [Lachnospiraceae bacterium]|nr:4Fe-4S dicluster domain-containing protein [Lachnospiraceae bacterium]